MIPIAAYATVPLGTTLADAISALERAQEDYTASKYQHRAVLVLDKNDNVVGKIGQLRALEAIEPEYDFTEILTNIENHNFSEEYRAQLMDNYRSQGPILNKESLLAVATKKVEEFMQKPKPGEFVADDNSLDTAIHKLVAGRLQSLLVTHDNKIVGILRMADVFAAVFNEIRVLEPEINI